MHKGARKFCLSYQLAIQAIQQFPAPPVYHLSSIDIKDVSLPVESAVANINTFSLELKKQANRDDKSAP